MADVYYDAQATGANNGTSWTNAYQTYTAALAGSLGADDKLWASDTSLEIIPATTVFTFNNQVITSVDAGGSVPPVEADFKPGAFIGTSAGKNLTLKGGNPYIRGMFFEADNDLLIQRDILIEEGGITVPGVADKLTLTTGRLTLKNSVLTLSNISASITIASATFIMKGGSVVAPAGVTTLISSTGGGMVNAIFDGVDLSDITTQLIDFISGEFVNSLTVIGCLLDAGVLLSASLDDPLNFAANYGSSDTNKPYYIQEEMYEGVIQAETTIVKTGGSSDGVTPISLKYITNANARSGYSPAKNIIPILFWADTIGPNTFKVDLLTDGITLTEDDAWLELMHPQAGVQRALATSRVIDGANLPASVAVWDTTGIAVPIKQNISLTVNVGQKGWIEANICVAIPSSIVYVDAEVMEGNRQWLSGQAYINSESIACDCPIEDNVKDGVVYDFGARTGNRTDAPEDKVEQGFQYGVNGIGFTGTFKQLKGPAKVLKLDTGIKVIKI